MTAWRRGALQDWNSEETMRDSERLMALREAVVLVAKSSPWAATALCACSIASALIPAGILFLTRDILDAVVRGSPSGVVPSSLIRSLGVLLLLIVLAPVLGHLGHRIQEIVSELVGHSVMRRILLKAASLDLAHFETPEFYNKLRRAEQDAAQRPAAVLAQTLQLAQSSVTLLSMVWALFRFHWGAVFLLVACGAPLLFVQIAFARKGHDLRVRQTEGTRKGQYLARLLTSPEGFKETRLYQSAPVLLRQYEALWAALFAERRGHSTRRFVGLALTSGVAAVSYAAFYFLVAFAALRRDISVGEMTLYAGAYVRGQSDFALLMNSISGLYENALFIGTLREFLAFKASVMTDSANLATDSIAGEQLEFRNVWFRYPTSERWILKDLSFTIRAGSSISLVGRNGAGKSTIVKLICRLYDPDRGQILVDGRDIRAIALDDYQQVIGVVFQDFVRYQLDATWNIGVGDVHAINDEERIVQAAIASGASEFIERLPDGYKAVLGRLFHRGQELSSGQWQKIAIARGFMRRGKILILDEPAASLDPLAEAEVLAQMRALARDRISILISHRLMHAAAADRILVLDDGRVVEDGCHSNLMRARGQYHTLFRTQLASYGAQTEQQPA